MCASVHEYVCKCMLVEVNVCLYVCACKYEDMHVSGFDWNLYMSVHVWEYICKSVYMSIWNVCEY